MHNATADPIASAPDPLDAIVDAQMTDRPAPHPDLAGLAREAVNPAPPEQFDPALHETDPATGGPRYNKDGTLKRRRGRRAGVDYSQSLDGSAPGPTGEALGGAEPAVCSPAQAKREAKLIAGGTFKTLQSFGEQWKPTEQEAEEVIRPLADLLQEMGGLGMPKWAEVAVAFGGYVIARLNLARFLPPGFVPPDQQQMPAGLAEGEPGPAVLQQPTTREGVSGGEGFGFGAGGQR